MTNHTISQPHINVQSHTVGPSLETFLSREHFQTLRQRRDYLRERIKAKQVVGWDWQYDHAEQAALEAALKLLFHL